MATANNRGIAEKGSRRALWCKGDDKKSIKLPKGGCYRHPSPSLHFCSSTVLSLDPVFTLYWEEHSFGSSPPGLRCHMCHWLEYILDSPWKMRIMCTGSLGQQVQCQAHRCSHIDHLIWWGICWVFFKHHLFLKEYELRGVTEKRFDRNLIVLWGLG